MLLDSVMKRATISATIGIALKGAKNDPRRSIRNTLDLFEHFTTELFDEQTMNKIRQDLENPKSYLFRLVTKTVKSVDNTLLKTVGTNLCYNRLVIFPFKENNKPQKIDNISYPVTTLNAVNTIVEQGVKAGVYFYIIEGNEPFDHWDILLNICRNYSECVFYIKTSGENISEQMADDIVSCGNIILAISINEGKDPTQICASKANVFNLLKKHRCLYGFCVEEQEIANCSNSGFIDCMVAEGCSFGWFCDKDDLHKQKLGSGKPIIIATTQSDARYLLNFNIGGRCHIMFGDTLTSYYQLAYKMTSNE